jgi:hypothetical protein
MLEIDLAVQTLSRNNYERSISRNPQRGGRPYLRTLRRRGNAR